MPALTVVTMESGMPGDDRIKALDRQRSTARRYRKLHLATASSQRLLAAAVIEARAGHRILKERLDHAQIPA
jgi:hypothetical protein